MIFVYDDGVHNQYALIRALQDAGLHWRICSAADLINGALAEAQTLIMPGGADLYYCEKLNGDGNAAIRDFVEGGGHYLGICAGAYYACRRIFWAQDEGDTAICGERELGLFPGTARGPIYPFLQDENIRNSWKKAVRLQWVDGQMTTNLYEGGPLFEGDAGAEFEILARFDDLTDSPAAIIRCGFGKGVVTLSSAHIEATLDDGGQMVYQHNNPNHLYDLQQIDKLCKQSLLKKITEVS